MTLSPPEPLLPSLAADFRLAMRRQASTVTLITTREGPHRHGMAATAVSSVTAAPPTLLICVNRSASLHGPLMASGIFCVNLLGLAHAGLVPLFSGKAAGEDRFRHGVWIDGHDDLPCLDDAPASLCCATLSTTACGSHTVVIGAVREIRLAGDARPLVYQDGSLARTELL